MGEGWVESFTPVRLVVGAEDGGAKQGGIQKQGNIDYLLTAGSLKEIMVIESKEKIECLVSRWLAQKLAAAAQGFGSSDCSCETHLYFASTEEQMREALNLKSSFLSAGPKLVFQRFCVEK